VPRAEYVITVDADSLLLHDYALRLTEVMRQPAGRRFGIAQTPYTAVPGTPISLERAAGAQTDLQWIMSQGLTHFDATFWIGASALLRYKALEDICEIESERGHAIRKYVRDRTLTEDSDSTIDLIAAGWQLYNYPDRLSYSATPPDFGALVIQRRRWANGSLLILPKLFRYLLARRGGIRQLPEAILRTHYLASTALGCLVSIVLLLYPFQEVLNSRWLPWAALPYYILYGRDLAASGYRWRDLPQIVALSLLLIPVNLGGVVKSLHQWWTGRPPVFARTPKVTGRTAAPALYVMATLVVPVWTAAVGSSWLYEGHPGRAVFSFVGTLVFLYGPVHFIGVRGLCDDLVANIGMRIRRAPAERVERPPQDPPLLGAHGAPASRGPHDAVCASWGGTERSGVEGSPHPSAHKPRAGGPDPRATPGSPRRGLCAAGWCEPGSGAESRFILSDIIALAWKPRGADEPCVSIDVRLHSSRAAESSHHRDRRGYRRHSADCDQRCADGPAPGGRQLARHEKHDADCERCACADDERERSRIKDDILHPKPPWFSTLQTACNWIEG
jgi:hypothetical protein